MTSKPLAVSDEKSFAEVVEMIQAARGRAVAAVNTALIDLYWQLGEFISSRIGSEGWGKSTVAELSDFIQKQNPGMRGFSPQNLWRMRQFFDTYREQPELRRLRVPCASRQSRLRTRLVALVAGTKLNCPTRSYCKPSCTSSTR